MHLAAPLQTLLEQARALRTGKEGLSLADGFVEAGPIEPAPQGSKTAMGDLHSLRCPRVLDLPPMCPAWGREWGLGAGSELVPFSNSAWNQTPPLAL